MKSHEIARGVIDHFRLINEGGDDVHDVIPEWCLDNMSFLHDIPAEFTAQKAPVRYSFPLSRFSRTSRMLSAVAGCLANFFQAVIFPAFPNYKMTGYVLDITFIYDICCHSLA